MEEERILCEAIHYNDGNIHRNQPKEIESGFIIAGYRHDTCVYIKSLINSNLREVKQGFLTNKKRFVDGYEAFEIAQKAGQILDPELAKEKGKRLLSEDLW